jgi:hypothetical protein
VRRGRIVAGNESSALNRAVAFYRHFVGIPPTGSLSGGAMKSSYASRSLVRRGAES